jgi:DNA-binding transcriptional LysR family regulator
MDRLDAMITFVAVCDANGFAAAARRLGLSPSVVTRQVAALEEHLGARLLQRTTRAVGLTEPGTRYLERARRILAELDEAELSAQSERAEPTGKLSISAPLLFGRLHVAPVLVRFMSAYPQVAAELHLSDRIENLIEEGHDLAIRIGHLPDSQLIARRLGATRRVLVASPAYLKRRGTPRRLADIARHDTINFMGVVPTADWRFAVEGREVRVRVTPRYVTNSGDAAIGYAIACGGLTLALCYQVSDAIRRGELVEVLRRHAPPPLPIQAVYPSSRLLSTKVRAFVDMIEASADWRWD